MIDIFRKSANQLKLKIESMPMDVEEELRFKHYTLLTALALPTMAGYAGYACFQQAYLPASFILFSGAGLCAGWFSIYRFRQGRNAYRVNTLLFSILLLYLQTTGGGDGSKALWIHIFPLIVIFLFGKKEGLCWTLGLFAAFVPTMALAPEAPDFQYAPEYIVRFSLVYLIITAVIFRLEHSRSYYRERMNAKNKELEQAMNIFTSGPVAVFKWRNEPGWPVEYVSSNVADILSYSRDEFLKGGTTYARIVHGEDLDRVREEVAFGSKSSKGHFAHAPYRIVKKDGSVIWVDDHTSVVRDGNNEITHYHGYVVDISQRKKYESRLKEQYDFLKTLMNTLPCPVFFKNREGVYLGCNRAFEKAVGMRRSDIVGKSAHELAPAELAEKYEEKDRALLAAPGLQTYDWKIETAGGMKREVIFNKATFVDENNETAGIIGVITDITKRKRAEAEREQLIAELRDALEKIKTLSGFIPICSSCKKIRDDSGYWSRIETYIEQHSDALFSHGICPECSRTLYPELIKD